MKYDQLTTEKLRKKFKNNFDLCNLAIQVGKNLVLGGHPSTLGQILQAVEDRIDESSS